MLPAPVAQRLTAVKPSGSMTSSAAVKALVDKAVANVLSKAASPFLPGAPSGTTWTKDDRITGIKSVGPVRGVLPLNERRRWDPELKEKPRADAKKRMPTKKITVATHFRRNDADLASCVKITLPLSWEDRPIRDAIVAPFVRAYDAKFPQSSATAAGPYEIIRVQYWSGPKESSATIHQYVPRKKGKLAEDRDPDSATSKMMAFAAEPTFVVLQVAEPVSSLREHADEDFLVEIELVPVESFALVVHQVTCAQFKKGGHVLVCNVTQSGWVYASPPPCCGCRHPEGRSQFQAKISL